MQLQESLGDLVDANTMVVGVSYDSVDILASFAESGEIEFPLLSDPDCAAIEAYGLLNDGRRKMAHPATILVGQDGTIKAKLYEDGYRARHSANALVEEARKLD